MHTTTPLTKEQILLRLTALCSQSEHCIHDMVEKMQRWEVDERLQAEVIEYLLSERYIDEERYCRAFVRSKMEYNRWGRRKIEQALFMKRIDKAVSAPILDDVSDEAWCDILRPLLEQKRRTTKGRNDYEVRQKLYRFALGRGFLYEQVSDIIGSLDTE